MTIKKLILPMLILICAIAMAFNTNVKEPQVFAHDYILFGGSWQPIAEQNCSGTTYTCRVKFQNGGTEYDVYDEMNDTKPKGSSSKDATLINQ